jgi:hypothetical protein
MLVASMGCYPTELHYRAAAQDYIGVFFSQAIGYMSIELVEYMSPPP